MSRRGRFIVFEGGEACGKSTQARRLAEARCIFTFEPGATHGCTDALRSCDPYRDSMPGEHVVRGARRSTASRDRAASCRDAVVAMFRLFCSLYQDRSLLDENSSEQSR